MVLDIGVLVAISVVVTAILYVLYKRSKSEIFFSAYPEPPGDFFLGHAMNLRSTTELLGVIHNYMLNHGKTIIIRVGPTRKFVFTSDYKFSEFLLSTNAVLNKSENYKWLEPWLGTGLLNSEAPKWKVHRKIITPAFHFEILKKYFEVFETVGQIFIGKLEQHVGNPSLDVYPLVTLCTLDIICETAMGTKINAQEGESSDYVRSVKEASRIIIDRGLSPIKNYNITFPLTRDFYVQRKALKIMHKYSNTVIKNKIKELEQRKETDDNEKQDEGIKKKMAFLDLLLKSRDKLTFEEIREEVDTFMFEGHDTTASAISFTLYCLANHPEVQRKAWEEQKQFSNAVTSFEDVQNMKYLESVIKETLRIYPSVPIIGRSPDRDVEFDGKLIPKGVNIAIFNYSILKNPEHFPDPDKFDPDRYEKMDGSFPYSYIPFSAGSRNCIGQKFAMLEIKSVVSKVLRNFELVAADPTHQLKLSAETVLRSVSGMKIGLRKRQII